MLTDLPDNPPLHEPCGVNTISSGRSDTNVARIKAGQLYLHRCDGVFILSKISRALTDDSLESSVYSMPAQEMPVEWEINREKRLQVTVIRTKTYVSIPKKMFFYFSLTKVQDITISANKQALIPENGPEFKCCIQSLEKEAKQAKDEKRRKFLEIQ